MRKRLILSAASAAGVSVAFGSPLGGVLFGLEELDLFSNEYMIWTAFVTSVVASGKCFLTSFEWICDGLYAGPVSLQYLDPFGTGKLVLFQVCIPLCGMSDA